MSLAANPPKEVDHPWWTAASEETVPPSAGTNTQQVLVPMSTLIDRGTCTIVYGRVANPPYCEGPRHTKTQSTVAQTTEVVNVHRSRESRGHQHSFDPTVAQTTEVVNVHRLLGDRPRNGGNTSRNVLDQPSLRPPRWSMYIGRVESGATWVESTTR